MKKNTIKKISTLIAGLGLATVSNLASAQWAVTNVNDTMNQAIWKAGFNSVSTQGAAGNVALQQIMTQQVKNQEDTQKRDLYNSQIQNLQAKTGANVQQPPSLQQCIQLSQNRNRSAAGAAAGGGGGNSYHPDNKLDKAAPSIADIQTSVVKDKAALGTCTANDAGIGGCSGTGQSSPYAAGDYHPRSLLGNVQGIPLNTTGSLYNNYTFGAKELQVASKNVQNAALYGNPIGLTEQENKNAPTYDAEATIIRSKLAAAAEALMSVVRMKQAPTTPINGTAKDLWADAAGNYTQITGNKQYPSKPSLYDILNYSVYNQFLGNDTAALDIQEVNKRLALNNFLMWKLYQQQEQMLILQAQSLTQQVTPVSASNVYKIGKEAQKSTTN